MTASLEERFWAKVDKCEPEECWLWTGDTTPYGYGTMVVNGIRTGAHRVSWMLANGPIPVGKHIDHICHCEPCVNPRHLRPATNAENHQNQGMKPNNKVGFKGVSRNHGRWMARIEANLTSHYLGTFDTPEDAHRAYCEAATRLHGEFANTGRPK